MDPELLARFRRDEPGEALTAVYHLFARPLDRVVRRGFTLKRTGQRMPGIKDREKRADVTQETFRRAFELRARLAYDGEHDYLTFLVGIARNVMAGEHRHHGRELPAGGRDSWAEDQVIEFDLHDEPDLDPELQKAIALMREYVATLPEHERAFHTARHLECRTLRDVAELFHLTVWNVRTLEDRLRAELLALLTRAGLTGAH